jgi:hypothetical protein
MGRNFKIDRCKLLKNGGASRDRTDDLIVANDALSQLSYSPVLWEVTFFDFTSRRSISPYTGHFVSVSAAPG